MERELSLRHIVKLTWPTVISQTAVLVISLVDLFFVGQFGVSSVAAVSIAGVTWATFCNFFEGLRLGTATLTARYLGAGEPGKIKTLVRSGLAAAVIVGIILLIVGYHLTGLVYSFFGDPAVRQMGYEYLPILLFSGGFVLITFVSEGLFRGLKRPIIPMIITLVMHLTNACLDYIFTKGTFGLPRMGVRGVALATFIAHAFGALISLAVIAQFNVRWGMIKERVKEAGATIREYLAMVSNIGAYNGSIMFAMFLFTIIFGMLGASFVAAYEISHQVFLMAYIPSLAFMVTTSVIAGKLLGELRGHLVTRAALKIFAVAISMLSVLIIVQLLFAENIALLFCPHDKSVAMMAARAIRLATIEEVIVLGCLVLRGILNAAKDTFFLVIENLVLGYFVFLPLVYFMVIALKQGLVGGVIAAIIWATIDVSILISRVIIIKRRQLWAEMGRQGSGPHSQLK